MPDLLCVCCCLYSVFLDQMTVENWSVFVIRGVFPVVNQSLSGRGKWYDMAKLLPKSASLRRSTSSEDDLARAIAQSLQDQHQHQPARSTQGSSAGNAIVVDDGDDDEDALMKAIAMSLTETAQPSLHANANNSAHSVDSLVAPTQSQSRSPMDVDDEEDSDLKQAILMSLSQQTNDKDAKPAAGMAPCCN